MTSRLSVSIVLYNTAVDDIRNCLRSLARYQSPFHLFLIDNSPTDALRAEASGKDVTYVHLPENPGFGAGHNVALLRSASDGYVYHLVINADVSFESDVLTPLLDFMDKNPAVGHVMPLVLNPDGTIQRLCKLVPTPLDLLFRRFLPKSLRDARNRHFELHQSGYDRAMFVPYLSGCFMLLRQAALAEVGHFDERFFMYPEDIDLTRRIASNYDTMFLPIVSVTHGYGGASYKSIRMFIIHSLNIIRYFNKWGWFFDKERERLNARTLAQFEN